MGQETPHGGAPPRIGQKAPPTQPTLGPGQSTPVTLVDEYPMHLQPGCRQLTPVTLISHRYLTRGVHFRVDVVAERTLDGELRYMASVRAIPHAIAFAPTIEGAVSAATTKAILLIGGMQ